MPLDGHAFVQAVHFQNSFDGLTWHQKRVNPFGDYIHVHLVSLAALSLLEEGSVTRQLLTCGFTLDVKEDAKGVKFSGR